MRRLGRARHVPITENGSRILTALVLTDFALDYLGRRLIADPQIIRGVDFDFPFLREGIENNEGPHRQDTRWTGLMDSQRHMERFCTGFFQANGDAVL